MGILDKVQGSAKLIANRANTKIEQLSGLTTKLLLPGFKQIEKDLKGLGVDLSRDHNFDFTLSSNGDSFILDISSDYVYFNCWFENANVDHSGAYIEGVFVFFDASKPFIDKVKLPTLSGSIAVDDDGIITLDSSNIDDFEKYMDELMSYITRNSTLIIDTIEDATIDLLKNAGKL